MNQDQIFKKIVSLIKENSEVSTENITMNTSFQNDLALDSMRLIGAIVAVEDSFEIEIPDNKLFNIKTIGNLVNFIEDNI